MTACSYISIDTLGQGIGYEAAKAFFQGDKPYHVIFASRSLGKAESAIALPNQEVPSARNTVEPLVCDVANDESIEAAFKVVTERHGRLDVLIINAGVTYDLEFTAGKKSLGDSFNMAYDVNVTGANVMTFTFGPLLLKSSNPRLLFVADLSHVNKANEKYFPTPS
jgi:NAD(P)-dependent dehydrogenase (short-subunit alcohol dehydrogenase family)